MNYYELLGVDKKAEPDEIKHAYREKLKDWHPDKNPDRREEAEEMTKTLNIAYDVLSDPEKRKNYNRILRFSNGKDYGRYVNDTSFSNKVNMNAGPLKRIIRDVKDLYHLTKDSIRGDYKLHPVNLGIIAGGLLYFIIPADLIPDFIPIVGLVDDIAILTTIINSMQGELIKYRNWKDG
ncbi:DnaJ domain-containing protein [Thermodesulfobacteriota bacterium]